MALMSKKLVEGGRHPHEVAVPGSDVAEVAGIVVELDPGKLDEHERPVGGAPLARSRRLLRLANERPGGLAGRGSSAPMRGWAAASAVASVSASAVAVAVAVPVAGRNSGAAPRRCAGSRRRRRRA